MAETVSLSREYTIPLRTFWFRVPRYDRTRRVVKGIKEFIAHHMKVTDRDITKVKLDVLFNNEVWYRGRASPPSKITVKATKAGELVQVTFVKDPAHVAFARVKHAKLHKVVEKKEEKKEDVKPVQTSEQKKEEQEKEQASAQAKQTAITQENKAQQKATKVDKAQHPQRMALKK